MSRLDERPRPPQEPNAEECCGEGCVRCVFDLYESRLERYRAALQRWLEDQDDQDDQGRITPPADTPTPKG